jgi:hypothetical protein
LEDDVHRDFRKDISGWKAVATTVLLVVVALPAEASGKIYYGSRAGMTVTVKSISGLDTSHARITMEHTRDDAIGFCRDYGQENPVTEGCIQEELAVPLNDAVYADCTKGIFTDFAGEKFQFRGKYARSGDTGPKYLLLDLGTHEIADGSSASGYETNMNIFRALCPRTAPMD